MQPKTTKARALLGRSRGCSRNLPAQRSYHMFTAYIHAAMRRAHYEFLDDDEGFVGTIPGLQGVIGIGATLEECREELQSALEGWIWLGLKFGHRLPIVDDIDLDTPPRAMPEAA
jgi:predicted RNase H-like HicB family nuclease